MAEGIRGTRETLLDADGIAETIAAMAAALSGVEPNDDLALVGIRTRGVPLAERLREALEPGNPARLPLGTLDITLYRDDLSSLGPQPITGPTDLPFDVDGKTIVLVDDVIYTGRTARAAIEALIAFGRPRAVRLAVLVDRGHREYPIQPDIAGMRVATQPRQVVEVNLRETDGEDRVDLATPTEER